MILSFVDFSLCDFMFYFRMKKGPACNTSLINLRFVYTSYDVFSPYL